MPEIRPLTKRQRLILGLITKHIARYGYAPSISELAAQVGINLTAVHGHLKRLEVKGVIRRQPKVARGIQLTAIRNKRAATARKK